MFLTRLINENLIGRNRLRVHGESISYRKVRDFGVEPEPCLGDESPCVGLVCGSGDAIRNGQIGDVYGVKVYVSTNCPTTNGSGAARVAVMFHPEYGVLIEQLGVRVQTQYKQAAVDAFTGAGEAAKKLQDELAILRGETTAQEQELARLSAAGASNAQIEMLRQMQAERAKLIEQQDVQRQKEAELASAAAATEAALKASAEAAKADAEAIKKRP